MKISEILLTPVEATDAFDGGYILSVCRDGDVVSGYVCCDENENEHFVPAKKMKFDGGCAKAAATGKTKKKNTFVRLGYPLYADNGKYLGRIDDFTVRGGKLVTAFAGNKRYPCSRLAFGDVAILKNDRAEAESAAKNMFIGAMLSTAPEV